ncbi:hypothetical protein CROQUDRAFT_670039 [Cronartium quercuum f. sp. fusiforme G11]|uniref:Complex 1 LYR protein domain-containing protein n=1 Tax=Cronartium quercuum f. sp. fusiforme G11 TaxID=708437 RepID=A0A9P6TD96_9BASI|nr:hypothetical protein CROQUDRAFT_670039 [Cronartium quercuum f. sp. fusiforme G11]
MHLTISRLAAASRHLPTDGFSLSHFLIWAEVRATYRKILRETRGLGSSKVRMETINWIRYDFDRHLNEPDQAKLKDLISQGKRHLRELSNQNILNGGQFGKLRGGRG